ncbi:MAG: hypothetical protein ACRCZA_00750 [Shewanella sp.]|uniref:hypothetical protein n=1 Tax=Shewanella sp. TaxID=50422 RepID=UPI003F33768B
MSLLSTVNVQYAKSILSNRLSISICAHPEIVDLFKGATTIASISSLISMSVFNEMDSARLDELIQSPDMPLDDESFTQCLLFVANDVVNTVLITAKIEQAQQLIISMINVWLEINKQGAVTGQTTNLYQALLVASDVFAQINKNVSSSVKNMLSK